MFLSRLQLLATGAPIALRNQRGNADHPSGTTHTRDTYPPTLSVIGQGLLPRDLNASARLAQPPQGPKAPHRSQRKTHTEARAC